MGPFRGDKDVILRLFPARSIEAFKRAAALELGCAVAKDRIAAAPPVGRPSLLRPSLLTQVTCLSPMDVLAIAGRNRRARIEWKHGIAHKERRRPDEGLIPVAGRSGSSTRAHRQAENADGDRQRRDRNARQNERR
jgi:hypothetical protein